MKRPLLLLLLFASIALVAPPATAATDAVASPLEVLDLGVAPGIDFRAVANVRTNAVMLDGNDWTPVRADAFSATLMDPDTGVQFQFDGDSNDNRLVVISAQVAADRDSALRDAKSRLGEPDADKFFHSVGTVLELFGWRTPESTIVLGVPVAVDADGLCDLGDFPLSLSVALPGYKPAPDRFAFPDIGALLFDPAVAGTREKPYVILPELPPTNSVAGYAQVIRGSKVRPVDRTVGDAIFALLDGYRGFRQAGPYDPAADAAFGKGSVWLYFARENCTTSSVWLSADGAWAALTDDYAHLSIPEDRRAAMREALAPLVRAVLDEERRIIRDFGNLDDPVAQAAVRQAQELLDANTNAPAAP